MRRTHRRFTGMRSSVSPSAAVFDSPTHSSARCRRQPPGSRWRQTAYADAIVRACERIDRADRAPSLAQLAREAGLSPTQFRRVFAERTGLTPKAYSMARRSNRVRAALADGEGVTRALHAAGFGSSSRFYEHATSLLGMVPSSYRAGAPRERILFAVDRCSLGAIVVAATARGVCAVEFGSDRESLVRSLKRRFDRADFVEGDGAFGSLVAQVIAAVEEPARAIELPLDVRGTAFQHRVWTALRRIPLGSTRSYSQVAASIGAVKSVRAVAAACAANPAAIVVPCHRVIGADGSLTGYRWGVERKRELLDRERRDATLARRTPAPRRRATRRRRPIGAANARGD